jgi:MFS family permease
MGWTSPWVIAALAGGIALPILFGSAETRVVELMFDMGLIRIRAFSAGNLADLLAALARGGLLFIAIIWLQGIYLPRHGHGFSQTPLWAGIYLLPLTAGFLLAGPASGFLSDHFGARPFATAGMMAAAVSFILLDLLPVDFAHWQFALIMLLNEIGMGLFTSPNLAGVMNSLPPGQRGAGAGMTQTFQDSGTVLSIGIFFTLIITGAGGVASYSSAARADRAWGARDRCGASGISEFLRSSRCGLACTCLPATSATTPSSRREGRVRICRSGQSWPVAAMRRRDPGPRGQCSVAASKLGAAGPRASPR